MLKMRLQRRGKKNYATYRVVVAEQRAPIKGRFVADLGPYNPHTDEFKVDADKVQEWLEKGVQPSATVHNLLVNNGIIKSDKVTSWRPKVKKAEEGDPVKSADADHGAGAEESAADEAKEEPKAEKAEEKEPEAKKEEEEK